MTKKIKQGKLIRQQQEETIAKLESQKLKLEYKLMTKADEIYYDIGTWYKRWLNSLKEEIEHEKATTLLLRWGGEGVQVDGQTIWTLPKGYPEGMNGWCKDALGLTCDRLGQTTVLQFFRKYAERIIEAVKDDYSYDMPSPSEQQWILGYRTTSACLEWIMKPDNHASTHRLLVKKRARRENKL